MLAHDRLVEVLEYDPESGVFRWREKICKKVVVGSVAGSENADGYIAISVLGIKYYAHRLAWFYMTKAWPTRVDHQNNLKSDNRWANLRLATKSQNAANSKVSAANTSGHKGVYWHRKAAKWQAYIVVDGVRKYLGLFTEKEKTAAAYERAALAAFNEFARAR